MNSELVTGKQLQAGWRIKIDGEFCLIYGLDFTRKDNSVKVDLGLRNSIFILVKSDEEREVIKSKYPIAQ